MASKAGTITENGTITIETDVDDRGVSLQIPSVAALGSQDLGGGTLSLKTQVFPAEGNPEEIDAPVLGENSTYDVGGQMVVSLTLSGATDPSVKYKIATYT